MMEWAAEQPTEVTTTAIDIEFLLTDTCITWSCTQQLMALTRNEANDTVVKSRKNSPETWRRLQKRYDPTTGGRKRNLLRTIISLGWWTLLGTPSGDRTLGVLRVSLREEDEG